MARTESTIANYDARTADEITQRLRNLSQADLAKLERYERRGQNRTTVLERIASLRGEAPWPGYDEMEVEDVNDALRRRNGDVASRVLDYERQHKGRTSVMEVAKRRQAGKKESAGRPRSTARSGSSRSSGAAKASSRKTTSARKGSAGRNGSSARKGASASSRSGSAAKSGSRSTGGRSGKASASKTGATGASRPRAASGSQRSGNASRGGSKSSSGGGSRPRTQARSSSRTRSSPSGARGRRAPQKMPARLKQRGTGALHSGERRAKGLAKDAGQVVGTAAKDSREAIGSTARDAGQTVGAAAIKAKGPVLMGGAVLAALGGGIALGRGLNVKLRRRKRVLGVPIPRRTAVAKAAKRAGHAVDSVSSTGHQIGRWSDDLQELRQRVAGKSPRDKVTGSTSPG